MFWYDYCVVDGVSYDYGWSFDGSTDVGHNISAPGSAHPRGRWGRP